MAVFTKTYVQCDLCEAQCELPTKDADGFYRVESTVSRLNATAAPNEKLATRTSDICQTCYSAVQEGEFSTLFFAERQASAPRPRIAPVP